MNPFVDPVSLVRDVFVFVCVHGRTGRRVIRLQPTSGSEEDGDVRSDQVLP